MKDLQSSLFDVPLARDYSQGKSMSSWAEEDLPLRKFQLKGKAGLTSVELISILIGSGISGDNSIDIARNLLHSFDNNLDNVATASIFQLTRIRGIGPAKAVRILTALEIGNRRRRDGSISTEKIAGSRDVFDSCRHIFADSVYETFWIVLLNRANRVMKTLQISDGGISGTIADPKRIFKTALDLGASGIILMHNHPSGNIQPSETDIRLTKKMKEAGLLLDLPVLDHMIFGGGDTYYSFKDEGLI